jgi:hypothetical protein
MLNHANPNKPMNCIGCHRPVMRDRDGSTIHIFVIVTGKIRRITRLGVGC